MKKLLFHSFKPCNCPQLTFLENPAFKDADPIKINPVWTNALIGWKIRLRLFQKPQPFRIKW